MVICVGAALTSAAAEVGEVGSTVKNRSGDGIYEPIAVVEEGNRGYGFCGFRCGGRRRKYTSNRGDLEISIASCTKEKKARDFEKIISRR